MFLFLYIYSDSVLSIVNYEEGRILSNHLHEEIEEKYQVYCVYIKWRLLSLR
jgi:hypothetical protein